MTDEAHLRKEQGMHLALTPDPLEEWKKAFTEEVIWRADRGFEFTSETITDIVGLPNPAKTNRNNAVGAMMNRLAKRGIIVKTGVYTTGKSPQSHGRAMPVWRGA